MKKNNYVLLVDLGNWVGYNYYTITERTDFDIVFLFKISKMIHNMGV